MIPCATDQVFSAFFRHACKFADKGALCSVNWAIGLVNWESMGLEGTILADGWVLAEKVSDGMYGAGVL